MSVDQNIVKFADLENKLQPPCILDVLLSSDEEDPDSDIDFVSIDNKNKSKKTSVVKQKLDKNVS